MTLIADVFAKLRTPEYVLKQMSKNSCFRRPFDNQHGKGPNTVEIWTAPPLPYLLMTVKAIELEKISLSNMQSLKNVF